MSIFDDIRLEWGGREYVIRSNRVMGAIARIEDVVTLDELRRYGEKQTAPLGKMAMAYGSVLRYAGAVVADDEVYAGMFAGESGGADAMAASIYSLLEMMLPPGPMPAAGDEKELPPGNGKPAAARSSKKRTRRRSVAGR